jgi:aryl-alcohol dehydrogenase-like predicted oxidoreductase
MEYRELGNTGVRVSVIGLGTWVIGGWMWGGAEDRDSLATIRRAIDLGINLIDTAPIYGHGRSEELVGQAVAESGRRDTMVLATKVGLDWNEERTRVWRNSRPSRITREVEASLTRLRTDVIDIYQVHWPDPDTPFEDSMEALLHLQRQGKIRFIGVSNYSQTQIERCLKVGPVQVVQPPFNLFERGIEQEGLLQFCRDRRIGTLVYGPLCRGLLSGKYLGDESFPPDDVRAMDPKFQGERFRTYVACVDRLKEVARRYRKTVGQLAIRWCLDQPGVTVALCGARRPGQIEENAGGAGWSLSVVDQEEIGRIVATMIPVPLGPEFMGPP